MRPRFLLIRTLQALEAAPIWAVLGLMKLLPRRLATGAGAAVARAIGPFLPTTRVARRNLALCFPEKSPAEREALLRAMWDNLGRNAGEFANRRAVWDPTFHAASIRYGVDNLRAAARRGEHVNIAGERIEVDGAEQFRALLDSTRPVVMFAAHLGNWEMLHWIAAGMGLEFAVLYRRPNNPLIARAVEGRRGGLVEFLPKGLQGAFGAARVMERGGRIAIMADVKENKGIAVPFFGHDAMTGTVAATLAIRYGAAIHGTWTQRLGPGRARITVEPPLEVPRTGDEVADTRAIMTAINTRVEQWVRERPDQWLWLHRRWPKELYDKAG